MAKFESVEARVYPTLALTLDAGAVVDLPDDTDVAGLVLQSTNTSKKAAPVVADPAPVTEGVADGAPTQS